MRTAAIAFGPRGCGLFLALALRKFTLPRPELLITLGATTYPLYLRHNQIGKALWLALPDGLGDYGKLLVIAAAVAALVWAVVLIAERRLGPMMFKALRSRLNGLPDEQSGYVWRYLPR